MFSARRDLREAPSTSSSPSSCTSAPWRSPASCSARRSSRSSRLRPHRPALPEVRGAEILLRWIPIGGYVQFWRSEDDPAAPLGTVLFDRLPGYKRAAAQLAARSCCLRPALRSREPRCGSPPSTAPSTCSAAPSRPRPQAQSCSPRRCTPPEQRRCAPFGACSREGRRVESAPSSQPERRRGPARPHRASRRTGDRVRSIATVGGAIVMIAVLVAWIVAIVTWLRR